MSTQQFTYFGVGTAVGFAVAIMLAPKSGSETREYLRSRADDGANFARTQASAIQTAASEAVGRGKKVVRQQVENIADAVDAGVQTYREAVQTTPAV